MFSHCDALVTFGDTEMRFPSELLEDNSPRATEKQLNYIEILKNDLGMSIQTRNAHITSIVGKRWLGRFTPGISTVPDVWALSRSEASQVIGKFRQWKEEAKK
jgi:hypothetical protein